MKTLTIVACALALFCGASALPNIAPNAQNCGNGIFCAHSQTCMSNTTGAGLLFACSPLPNAVRCVDARFSCPSSSACAENESAELGSMKCVAPDGSAVDAVLNVDPFEVAEMRDFGEGMQPTNINICGAITNNFRLPNFCRCTSEPLGGTLACTVGIAGVSIGASAWVRPCASPANFGWRAWASVFGMSRAVGQQWSARFQVNIPIPHASVNIGIASAGARAELSGEVSNMIISSRLAIGACGRVGIGRLSRSVCNPTSLLPITLINGPRFDFSRFCR